MNSDSPPSDWSTSGVPRRLLLMALVASLLCSIPVFLGLERTDLRNDEAIYSYAVERMLETGEWLTPRSIPSDGPFLEKPPLKFWMVAGLIELGIAPPNERGMRLADAALATATCFYIFLLAARFSGPLGGWVTLFVLLSFDPMVASFRSNMMEGPLILSYCGGLFHVLRWAEVSRARQRQVHSLAAGAFFVLGFMTKFVAAVFLPLVAALWVVQLPGSIRIIRGRWREWFAPLVLVVVTTVPWFVYQSLESRTFWEVILGVHVVTRMTSYLDPAHLAPWHFYFTASWRELTVGHSALIVAIGIVTMGWMALRGQQTARLMLLWWLVPMTLISLGSSKLLHYGYPFLPPLFIGAGASAGIAAKAVMDWFARRRWLTSTGSRSRGRLFRQGALGVGWALVAMAVFTYVVGPITLGPDGHPLMTNSSVVRPLALGLIALALAGRPMWAVRAAVAMLVMPVVPVHAFEAQVRDALTWRRPLGAARDCIANLQASGVVGRDGVFLSDPTIVSHPPYFYFRGLGPWTTGPDGWREGVEQQVFHLGAPAIVKPEQWTEVIRSPELGTSQASAAAQARAVRVEDGILILPGPYGACLQPIEAMGGTRVW